MVDPNVEVEQIATGFKFTEGPIWHPNGYLLFSDMPGGVRRKWSDADDVVEVMRPSNMCNGMTLDADLRLIVCEHWTSQVIRAGLNVEEMPLFLAAGGPKLGVYPQIQSSTLQVKIVVSLTCAFPSERQPKAVSVSSGTQWVSPTF